MASYAASAKAETLFDLGALAALGAVKPLAILATKPFAILTTLFSAVIGYLEFLK